MANPKAPRIHRGNRRPVLIVPDPAEFPVDRLMGLGATTAMIADARAQWDAMPIEERIAAANELAATADEDLAAQIADDRQERHDAERTGQREMFGITVEAEPVAQGFAATVDPAYVPPTPIPDGDVPQTVGVADVPEVGVNKLLAWIGRDPQRALAAYTAEMARPTPRPRVLERARRYMDKAS